MRGGLVRALGAACDAAPALRGAALGDSSRGFARSAGGAAAESDGKESSSGRGGGGEKSPNLLVKALEPAKLMRTPTSAEQLNADVARAKDYSRRKMAQLRARQVDLGVKIRLQTAAVEALPVDLRAAAAVPDYTPFPARRSIPMETAPVPGYFEALRAAAEEVVSSSALGGGKRR